MRKTKQLFLVGLLSLLMGTGLAVHPNNKAYALENVPYRSVYLIDYDTNTVIESYHEEEKYPIASMVKIMTLLLTFQEIEEGNLKYDDTVYVSETAAGMGGSQLFLSAGTEYPVEDLIKGVIICSANDCAVALGEKISGSHEAFVEKMNTCAQKIGMNHTLFCNATGLPCGKEQYSTAKDVTVMMQNLLHFPRYYEFTKIWMEDYTHPDGRVTQMVNTNKLIRQCPSCDAGKTGFTNDAMFCLSATARQNNTRFVGTILGSPDSKTRFETMNKLFQESFARYETTVLVRKGEEIAYNGTIKNAKNLPKNLYADNDICYFSSKNEKQEYTEKFVINENLCAPISRGTVLGKIIIEDKNGTVIGETGLYCDENIEKMQFIDYLKKVLENWKIKK